MRHSPWLDWLRFLAAFAVVICHARTVLFVEYSALSDPGPLTAAWYALTRQGHEAVLIFFVLSGFLVGGPAFQRAMTGSFRVRDYALDRAVRILVPLFPAVLITVAVATWIGSPMPVGQILATLASLQGVVAPVPEANYALWTLAYEVWFYVLGGALATLIGTRFRKPLVPVLLILLSAAVFSQLKPLYVVVWFAGAFAYFHRPARVSWPVVTVAVALVLAGSASYQFFKPNSLMDGAEAGFALGIVAGECLLTLGTALLLPRLTAMPSPVEWMSRAGASLSGFSYSLYLLHLALLGLSHMVDMSAITALSFSIYLLTIAMVMVTAFLFARVFEANGPALKAYVRGRRAVVA